MNEESSLSKAKAWYSKAADDQHKDAMFRLGRFYQRGLVEDQNNEKEIEYFEKAGMVGDRNALYQLGARHFNGNHGNSGMHKAFSYFERSAKKENSQAQYKLGEIYEFGYISSKDLFLAIIWYTKSALQGNEDARNYLDALIYIPTDNFYYVKKHKQLSKLIVRYKNRQFVDKAFLGSVYYDFGLLCYHGHGTVVDYNVALEHFKNAHEYYPTSDIAFFSTIKFETIDKSIKESYLKKLEMFEKSSTKLSPKERYELGLIYYNRVTCLTESGAPDNNVIVDANHEKALILVICITKASVQKKTIKRHSNTLKLLRKRVSQMLNIN
jgi:TPR repeat protein